MSVVSTASARERCRYDAPMPDTGSRPEHRVSIIRNPHARSAPTDAQLAAPLEEIRLSGWTATVQDTTGPGDARPLAQAAALEGDGTVNR